MSIEIRNRRSFLRASGICLALPTLEAVQGAESKHHRLSPTRMVCMAMNLECIQMRFAQRRWRKLQLSPLLEPLQAHQRDKTLFSHLDHGLKGGHFAVHTF